MGEREFGTSTLDRLDEILSRYFDARVYKHEGHNYPGNAARRHKGLVADLLALSNDPGIEPAVVVKLGEALDRFFVAENGSCGETGCSAMDLRDYRLVYDLAALRSDLWAGRLHIGPPGSSTTSTRLT